MAQPDDSSSIRRPWRWLDWWFAPRWRALLAWAVLAELSSVVLDVAGYDGLWTVFTWPFDQFMRVTSLMVPSVALQLAYSINLSLLNYWFEPLALRLNLQRGIAWLVLRIIYRLGLNLLPASHTEIVGLIPEFLFAAAAVLVLLGWRSRPAICIAGTALSVAVFESVDHIPYLYDPPQWCRVLAWQLPFAAALLFGTRLLRPEERTTVMISK